MYTVDLKVGRLLEIRIVSPEDIQAFVAQALAVARRASSRLIACTDLRSGPAWSSGATDALLQMMRSDISGVERNAILVTNDPVSSFQVARMVLEVGSSRRRTFRAPAPARQWLAELLTEAELERLDQFLAEVPGAGATPVIAVPVAPPTPVMPVREALQAAIASQTAVVVTLHGVPGKSGPRRYEGTPNELALGVDGRERVTLGISGDTQQVILVERIADVRRQG